jgi:ERCC4-related helicase
MFPGTGILSHLPLVSLHLKAKLILYLQLIWFLTPTVALAEQQYAVISKQLPLYQSRLLLGSDNVDHWSTQHIWDKILLNIRIVVSTPQVLLDAMCHGFVKLSGLSLLVFDEGETLV